MYQNNFEQGPFNMYNDGTKFLIDKSLEPKQACEILTKNRYHKTTGHIFTKIIVFKV